MTEKTPDREVPKNREAPMTALIFALVVGMPACARLIADTNPYLHWGGIAGAVVIALLAIRRLHVRFRTGR